MSSDSKGSKGSDRASGEIFGMNRTKSQVANDLAKDREVGSDSYNPRVHGKYGNGTAGGKSGVQSMPLPSVQEMQLAAVHDQLNELAGSGKYGVRDFIGGLGEGLMGALTGGLVDFEFTGKNAFGPDKPVGARFDPLGAVASYAAGPFGGMAKDAILGDAGTMSLTGDDQFEWAGLESTDNGGGILDGFSMPTGITGSPSMQGPRQSSGGRSPTPYAPPVAITPPQNVAQAPQPQDPAPWTFQQGYWDGNQFIVPGLKRG